MVEDAKSNALAFGATRPLSDRRVFCRPRRLIPLDFFFFFLAVVNPIPSYA
jgi:hypothetical protein